MYSHSYTHRKDALMQLDEIEIRATLSPGDVMRGYLGRYASLDHFFLDHPSHVRVAVLANGVGTGYFMFKPNDSNTHLWHEKPGTKVCVEESCNRIVYAKEMCQRHYRKVYDANRKECSDMNCDTKVYARGLCNKHYQQLRLKERGIK